MSDPVERCTVEKRCSSTGRACGAEDRACANDATSQGLQVICETADRTMVWCPPDTARSDSNVVWILLVFAFALAIGGCTVAYAVLRKPKAAAPSSSKARPRERERD